MIENNKLRYLLAQDYLTLKNYDEYFSEVSKELMGNHVIHTNTHTYEIIEIEFYFSTPDHRDLITYPRKMDAGRWFFHQSGVDLSFRSNETIFGGILIRGIRRNDGKYIWGPLKCVDELWQDLDAFESRGYPTLKYKVKEFAPYNLWRGKRWIKIKEDDKLRKTELWMKQSPLNVGTDIHDYVSSEFDNATTHLYRYFYLSEDELRSHTPAYTARPNIDDLLKVCRNE